MECSHYTNIDGLIGIIKNKVLWASNIIFLNDSKEYLDILDHIRKMIPLAKIKEGDKDWVSFNNFINNLQVSLKTLLDERRAKNYSVSFSKEFDLLSQWRGYCPPNKGYGIVFEIDSIAEKAGIIFNTVYHRDCVYHETDKSDFLRDILNLHFEKFNNKNNSDNCFADLELELDKLACFFKDESFQEEKESRLVISLNDDEQAHINFRAGEGSIIPYICIPFDETAIKKIIIGPTTDPVRAENSLRLFLKTIYKNDIPEIQVSNVPFRSW